MSLDPDPVPDWPARWARLATRVGLEPDQPLLVALSGGADSVLVLHLAARARPRPSVFALHVDHGLRGAESRAEARFCAELCARLAVPLRVRRLELDPRAPDLEARARRARYAALDEEARRVGAPAVATGHHADDALETLVLRWLRGTELAGLAGLRPRTRLPAPVPPGARPIEVVRPLIDMRREEVRALLRGAGLTWCEDSSNGDPRFTRNRVRHALLPGLAAACGLDAIDNLRAFGRAVESLEEELAARTAHVAWRPPARAAAGRSRQTAHLGGSLPRAELMALVPPLRRRALWRLLTEGTGSAPPRVVLDRVLADLGAGRCRRHALPGSWVLQLRSDRMHLSPPAPAREPLVHEPLVRGGREGRQLALPFARADGPPAAPDGLPLGLPGIVALPDGRKITAELTAPAPGTDVPRSPIEVELDAAELPGGLVVRWPRPGDRFRGLGAPGSRPLSRFLADAGVPLEERPRVPLVFSGGELVWVAGIRPGEARRVRRETTRRLRLVLHDAAGEGMRREPGEGLFGALGGSRRR